MAAEIFDRKLLKTNRKRYSSGFGQYNFLFKEIGARLKERIADFPRQDFASILEIGARDGTLNQYSGGQFLVQSELSLNFAQNFKHGVVMDDQLLCFKDNSFDLIISNLNLHLINDIRHNLAQIKNALKPGGYFIASFFGGQTLKELREVFYAIEIKNYGGISPRLIPFIEVKDAGMLMQSAGFKNSVADIEKIIISYSHPNKLFSDLKNMGEANILQARSKKFLSRKILAQIFNLYQELYSDSEGEVEASFEIVTIMGCK